MSIVQRTILNTWQENDLDETIERMFSYCGTYDENGRVRDTEDIFATLKEEKLVSDTGWQIVMLYRPKNTINPSDIENIVHDIESSGEYEVKILVHDYLKRIKPNQPTNDMRIDLGEVDFTCLLRQKYLRQILLTTETP